MKRSDRINGAPGEIESMAAPWFAHSPDLERLGQVVVEENRKISLLPRKSDRDFIKLVGAQIAYISALAARGSDATQLALAINAFEAFLYGRHFRLALQLESTKFNRWPRSLVGMMMPLLDDLTRRTGRFAGSPEGDDRASDCSRTPKPELQ
jgi:hypothetical protein